MLLSWNLSYTYHLLRNVHTPRAGKRSTAKSPVPNPDTSADIDWVMRGTGSLSRGSAGSVTLGVGGLGVSGVHFTNPLNGWHARKLDHFFSSHLLNGLTFWKSVMKLIGCIDKGSMVSLRSTKSTEERSQSVGPSGQVPISSTFYEQIFCIKVFCQAFLY